MNNYRGEMHRFDVEDEVAFIKALIGTSTTLDFGGAWEGTQWTVSVLGCKVDSIEGDLRHEGSKTVTVYLRRL